MRSRPLPYATRSPSTKCRSKKVSFPRLRKASLWLLRDENRGHLPLLRHLRGKLVERAEFHGARQTMMHAGRVLPRTDALGAKIAVGRRHGDVAVFPMLSVGALPWPQFKHFDSPLAVGQVVLILARHLARMASRVGAGAASCLRAGWAPLRRSGLSLRLLLAELSFFVEALACSSFDASRSRRPSCTGAALWPCFSSRDLGAASFFDVGALFETVAFFSAVSTIASSVEGCFFLDPIA